MFAIAGWLLLAAVAVVLILALAEVVKMGFQDSNRFLKEGIDMRKTACNCTIVFVLFSIAGCTGVDLQLGVGHQFENDIDGQSAGSGFVSQSTAEQEGIWNAWAAVTIQLSPRRYKLVE